MKASELKGSTIVAIVEGAKIGSVEDVLFDPEQQRVRALVVKSPRFAGPQVLPIESITNIGKDAVTIESAEKLQDRARYAGAENLVSLKDLGGRRVVSTTGHYVGDIDEVEIDLKTGQIRDYEITGKGFGKIFGRGHHITASDRMRMGKEYLVIPEELIPGQEQQGPSTHA